MAFAEKLPRITGDTDQSILMDLPCELWGKILKKVTQKDALNLRLTDKEFKYKVNKLYEDWNIQIIEESPFLEMILDLRFKKIKIKSLNKHPSFRPPGVLFKYPDIVQELCTVYEASVSPLNLHILLQCKNLKFIYIWLDDKGIPLDPLIDYKFMELHTLIIDICKVEPHKQFQSAGLFYKIMMQSIMPKLKSFQVEYENPSSEETVYNFSTALVSFLSQNGHNLQHFSYDSGNDKHYGFKFPPLDDSTVVNNMKSLKTLKLNWESSYSDEPLTTTWKRLIKNQRNLVEIYFKETLEIDNSFYLEIAQNNFNTLVSVKIKGLSFAGAGVLPAAGEFDISIFQNCTSLITLNLTNKCYTESGEKIHQEALNLYSMPEKIQNLYLPRFVVDSEEVSSFLMNHPCLSELCFEVSDLDPSILECVMAHGTLLSVQLRCIEVPNSRLKLARLKRIYEGLGCEEGQNGFDFKLGLRIKRASIITNWQGQYTNEDTDFWDFDHLM